MRLTLVACVHSLLLTRSSPRRTGTPNPQYVSLDDSITSTSHRADSIRFDSIRLSLAGEQSLLAEQAPGRASSLAIDPRAVSGRACSRQSVVRARSSVLDSHRQHQHRSRQATDRRRLCSTSPLPRPPIHSRDQQCVCVCVCVCALWCLITLHILRVERRTELVLWRCGRSRPCSSSRRGHDPT